MISQPLNGILFIFPLVVIEPVWKHGSPSCRQRKDKGFTHHLHHRGTCGWVHVSLRLSLTVACSLSLSRSAFLSYPSEQNRKVLLLIGVVLLYLLTDIRVTTTFLAHHIRNKPFTWAFKPVNIFSTTRRQLTIITLKMLSFTFSFWFLVFYHHRLMQEESYILYMYFCFNFYSCCCSW